MSNVTEHPFTVEQLREQQTKFREKHNTTATITELPPAYAEKLATCQTDGETTIGISEDVILARALKLIARPQKQLQQVMPYDIAKRIIWKMGNEVLAQHGREWEIGEEQKQVIENMVKYFINDPSCKYDLNRGLYVFGDVGRGKTFLLDLMKNFADAVPITSKRFRKAHCADIADRVLWSKDSTGNHLAEYQNGGWLFDDLGNEPGAIKTYGNEYQVMERVLVQRYGKFTNGFCLTHVTSNDTPDELEKKYGTRLADRAKEMFNFVFLKGDSKRKTY